MLRSLALVAAEIRREHRRRLHALAAMPTTIFSAGVLATVLQIPSAFKDCGSAETVSYEALVAGALAEAFVPAALGLMLAVTVWMCYRYLLGQAEVLSDETNVACLFMSPTATDLAVRAAMRRAAALRLEHSRHLNALAAIPVTVLFAGFMGTASVVLGSFKGCLPCSGSKEHMAESIARAFAEGFVWTLWGLAIAVFVWLGHRYLRERVENLDDEMAPACKDLAHALRLRLP